MKKMLFSIILITAIFLSLAFSVYAEGSLADDAYRSVWEMLCVFLVAAIIALTALILTVIALVVIIVLAKRLHSFKKKELELIRGFDEEEQK